MVNWKDIHPDFTEELQKEWEDREFSKERTKEWLGIGLKPEEFDFASCLEETLQDKNLNLQATDWSNLDELKEKHKVLIEEKKWTEIHPDFARGFNYSEKIKGLMLKKQKNG